MSIEDFYVVKALSLYNIISGRNWLTSNKVICSTYHLVKKFPTKFGIAKVRGDKYKAKDYMHLVVKNKPPSAPSTSSLISN